MRQDPKKLSRFEEAVLPHLDAAYTLARWIVNNDQDAEDMVQEAYLRAYKYFSGFQGTNSRSWMLSIVRNTCYTWLKQNRANELALELDDEMGECELSDPETLNQQLTNRRLVSQVLSKLPVEFREILILRELEEFSYKEIAFITGIPIGTVMSRLTRAHQKLKKELVKWMDEERPE